MLHCDYALFHACFPLEYFIILKNSSLLVQATSWILAQRPSSSTQAAGLKDISIHTLSLSLNLPTKHLQKPSIEVQVTNVSDKHPFAFSNPRNGFCCNTCTVCYSVCTWPWETQSRSVYNGTAQTEGRGPDRSGTATVKPLASDSIAQR